MTHGRTLYQERGKPPKHFGHTLTEPVTAIHKYVFIPSCTSVTSL